MGITFEDFETQIKGCIVGLLIGDALGYPYENTPNIDQWQIEIVPGQHGEPAGAWSYPGCFSLATMCSIVESETIDLEDIMQKFSDSYIAGHLSPDNECKDIGRYTANAIKNFTNGHPFDMCGSNDTNDADALFRIIPIGIYLAFQPIENIIKSAHSVCHLSHQDIKSQVACAALCVTVRNIITQQPSKVFDQLIEYYQNANMKTHLESAIELKNARNKESPPRCVTQTFWSAWSIYAANHNDFQLACIRSVYQGEDTNGRTSLVGALVGLNLGVEGLPATWTEKLLLNQESIEVIENFIKIAWNNR